MGGMAVASPMPWGAREVVCVCVDARLHVQMQGLPDGCGAD